MARRRFPGSLGWLALFAPAALYGQGELATVTGVVTDRTRSVITGAAIALRNTETNAIRSALSNSDGYFTLTELAPGDYELTASKTGFSNHRQVRIVLDVGQHLRNDIELALGQVNETISVTAQPVPINTEDGAIKGAVIVQQEIQDVPLDGRDFTDIAFLVPGVLPNAEGGTGSGMAINGARSDNTNFYVDGFSDRNARGAAAQLRPNIDSLEEFKMEVSGFSAQYGKMAGGILNMVLKSGTNRVHGTLFEYLRNDYFDARSFFDPVKLPLRRNQFGATVTGPVVVPKIYDGHDKTFFMISVEAYRNIDGQTHLNNVPTALERGGDFSQVANSLGKPVAIKDPLASNTAFPGGIIPGNRFSPVALNLMRYYPMPNYRGIGLNYQSTANVINNWASLLGKLDRHFGQKDTLSARYGYRWNANTAPWAGTNLGGFGNIVSDDRLLGGITFVHSFSPALVNELRTGVSRNSQHEHIDDSAGQPNGAQLGMAGSTTDPLAAGFPRANVTNYATLGYANNEPVQYFVTDYQVGDVLTWIHGKHIVKAGIELSMDQFNQPYYNNQRGTFTASGVWTGNGTATNGDAFADLMLGLLASSTITQVPTRNYLRWKTWGAFINDDFRIKSTLTLNLGLRWELDPPPHDKYDRLINFVPAFNKVMVAGDRGVPDLAQLVAQAGLTGRVALGKDFGLPDSLVFANYHNFAPRLGFAWRPFGGNRTVLRGGYGWFYSGSVLNQIRLDLGTSFPFSTNLSFARVTSNPAALTLASPWPVSIATLAGTNTSNGFQLHAPNAYVQNYSLTVERDLGRGNVLEVAYVGSKGTHLGRQYNINQPFRSMEWYQAYGTNFPVPFPPLSTINYYDFGSNSIYSAGQITVSKRASGRLFYRLGYTYSKSLDNASQLTGNATGGYAGALDARNLGLERGRSDFDRGHVFTAIFSYALPGGRGRQLLPRAGKMINGVFGGWQVSATVTAYTGPPFTVEDSSINASIGQSNRPNRIATGRSAAGAGHRGLDYPWYTVGAFVPTADCASRTNCAPDAYGFLPFTPGNAGRNILDGPGTLSTNTTLFRNFRPAEHHTVQARWEVFNIFNHPNFLLPNRDFNESSAGIISGVQQSGRGGPRTMQFALKYMF